MYLIVKIVNQNYSVVSIYKIVVKKQVLHVMMGHAIFSEVLAWNIATCKYLCVHVCMYGKRADQYAGS